MNDPVRKNIKVMENLDEEAMAEFHTEFHFKKLFFTGNLHLALVRNLC